jgi:hypothetical protein
MIHKTVLTALLACAALPAQSCPDLELLRIPQQITYGPQQTCSSLSFIWRGTQLGDGTNGCPSFAIVEPGYDSTQHRPGAATYAEADGQVAVTQLTFSCDLSYILFIPFSSTCSLSHDRVIAHRTSYRFVACAALSTGAASTDSAGGGRP